MEVKNRIGSAKRVSNNVLGLDKYKALGDNLTQAVEHLAAQARAERKQKGALLVWFAGVKGNNKNLAARFLAEGLGKDIYRVDLAQVISKYIGETEKNLGRIFDNAELAKAILFFDEADALFGKRTEVKDSHDRFANQEVAYLLERLEKHSGLTIISSNATAYLDPEMMRHVQYVINFDEP